MLTNFLDIFFVAKMMTVGDTGVGDTNLVSSKSENCRHILISILFLVSNHMFNFELYIGSENFEKFENIINR